MTVSLELKGLVVDHGGGARALDGVDLGVAPGELMTIVGPSGCGKSTLLRAVAGLVPPTSGEVWIDGRRVDALEPAARDVAFVFQSYALYPHMSVRANLEFPLRMARVARRERRRRALEVAERLGLGELLRRRPAQLSGGQMQRVALGRALVRRPKVFLLDEPLSNLDPRLRDDVRVELRRLHAELGVTTLHVTHDQAEAMTLGQRMCVLGEGTVRQVGEPLEVHARPASRFVADLFGSPPMNLVEGRVAGGAFAAGGLRVAVGWPEGPAVLGVRPEAVRLVAGEGAVVRDVERTGDRTVVTLSVGGEGATLRAVRPGTEGPPIGATFRIDLDRESVLGFECGPAGARIRSLDDA